MNFPLRPYSWCLFPPIAAWVISSVLFHGITVFPGDEEEYLFQGRIFAQGRAWFPSPSPVAAFHALNICNDGKWYGCHQPGHSIILTPWVRMGLPRAWPVVATGLLSVLGVALSLETFGLATASLAGALTCLSPWLLLTGATFASEVSAALLLGGMFLCLVKLNRTGSRAWAVLLALCWAGAVNVRLFSALGFAVPLCAWSFCVAPKGRRMLLLCLVVGSAGFVGTLAYNAAVAGQALSFPFRGWDPTPFGLGPHHSFAAAMHNTARNLFVANLYLLGSPVSGLLLLWALFRPHGESVVWGFLMPLAGLVFVYAFWWHPGQAGTGPLRYFEAAIPCTVLSARGLERVVHWAYQQGRESRRARLTVGVLVVVLLGSGLMFWPKVCRRLTLITAPRAEMERALHRLSREHGPLLCIMTPWNAPGYRPRGGELWRMVQRNQPDWQTQEVLYLNDLGPTGTARLVARFRLRRAIRVQTTDDGRYWRLQPYGKEAREKSGWVITNYTPRGYPRRL